MVNMKVKVLIFLTQLKVEGSGEDARRKLGRMMIVAGGRGKSRELQFGLHYFWDLRLFKD